MAHFLLQNKQFFCSNIVKSSLLSKSLDYEYIQLLNAFNFYKNIFEPIIQLEKYDKIGIEEIIAIPTNENENKYINYKNMNFKIYLDKYKIYQSISRWYWNQKRNLIFPKLDILFDDYNNLLEKIQLMNKNYESNFKSLFNDCDELNKQILPKLELLKETYNDSNINDFINKYYNILNKYNNISM